MATLDFTGKTCVITGAGGGLGKSYALFYASRGANVVVNDVGGNLQGEGSSPAYADAVVKEIKAAGGKAVADHHSVVEGDKIIKTAIDTFGSVHVVVCNAGILRDISFKNMKDSDWDEVIRVHVFGAYKTLRAAWPHFKAQKYGRIINTSSVAGIFGNFGQTNYSAAKMALIGFTYTLAKEGKKYNILANALAPTAASRMTETVMPPEVLANLGPEWVAPVVGVLTHHSSTETGSVIACGAGTVQKLRWQREPYLGFKNNANLRAGVVLEKWDQVGKFKGKNEYPDMSWDSMEALDRATKLPVNGKGKTVSFSGKVAIITGGGNGLGRAYALQFAELGASVVVNDLSPNAQKVVDEIKAAGGKAVVDKHSVVDQGAAIVQTAIDNFGAVHILVNNAGILRDKSFQAMDDNNWNAINDVHLRGTYSPTKAAWPHFLAQKYGRVINTTSVSGVYGNFGQTNYAAAKTGILGFSRALAREGAKYNINVSCIAPSAGTQLTATVMPEEMVAVLKPDYVAPFVVALCTDNLTEETKTGKLYEIGQGAIAMTRWEVSKGVVFPIDKTLTPEQVFARWSEVVDFSSPSYPTTSSDANAPMMKNFDNKNGGGAKL